MADPAVLQQQLDDLRTAYFSGAQTVSYDGKSTTFRSAAEMRAAMRELERQLGSAPITSAVVRSDKNW